MDTTEVESTILAARDQLMDNAIRVEDLFEELKHGTLEDADRNLDELESAITDLKEGIPCQEGIVELLNGIGPDEDEYMLQEDVLVHVNMDDSQIYDAGFVKVEDVLITRDDDPEVIRENGFVSIEEVEEIMSALAALLHGRRHTPAY